MSDRKQKPSRWYYLLAFLIPIFACLGTAGSIYLSVPDLPGTVEELGIQNLTQVTIPGSADVSFTKAGAYAVYYEYRSLIDGVSYFRDENPPSLRCQLMSNVTDEAVRLAPSSIKGNVYITHDPERAAAVFKQFSIDRPGVYTFSCQYPDGRPDPEIVMAVGPNIVLEFFSVALKPIAAILGGGFIFLCASGISLLITGYVAFRRHQSKNNKTL